MTAYRQNHLPAVRSGLASTGSGGETADEGSDGEFEAGAVVGTRRDAGGLGPASRLWQCWYWYCVLSHLAACFARVVTERTVASPLVMPHLDRPGRCGQYSSAMTSSGGHFAAMEEPDLLVADVRQSFRQLR